ncbi:MAG: hypothetical protein J5672_03425 [Verrucomicrobia bacterium]|nr:hypothetical protein [Verrucomicrobiota bacterium]
MKTLRPFLILCLCLVLNAIVPELFSAEPSQASSNIVAKVTIDPELQKIIDQDNETQIEVDKWIKDYQALNKTNAVQDATLPLRIRERFDSIKSAYEDYLFTHSTNMEARLAYASFLSDIGQDNDAAREWLKLQKQHPDNPVLWNNLGNYFAQNGSAKDAFPYYEKAIELAPKEVLYLKNLASVVYIYRQEAMEYYDLTEQQSLRLAQALYQKATLLQPDDFVLATSLAQTWYYITPFDSEKARAAWEKAYTMASDDSERQGIILHYARVAILNEQFDEALKWLDSVTYSQHQTLKKQLLENLEKRRELSAAKE